MMLINVNEVWCLSGLLMSLLTISTCLEPSIIGHPKNKDCNLNTYCNFECIAIPSVGVTIRWMKDDKAIVDRSRVSITQGDESGRYVSQLIFRQTNVDDSGSYKCVASNVEGSKKSNAALLRILGPPSVNTHSPLPPSIYVAWHESFNLQCKGEGTPPVTDVSWSWKAFAKGIDEPIVVMDGTHRRRLSDPNLTYLPREDDAMEKGVIKYEVFCTVRNQRGAEKSRTTIIYIRQKPGKPEIVDILSLDLGKAVNLLWKPGSHLSESTGISCQASFSSIHSFMKDLDMQPNVAGVKKQVIEGLRPSTLYSVTITCQNSIGKSEPSELFTFNTKEGVPEVVTDVMVKAINSSSFQVSWKFLPGNKVHGTLSGYKVKWKKEDGRAKINIISPQHNKLEIGNLVAGSRYGASVCGFTVTKDGSYSDMIFVTLPLFDEVFPPNITVSEVSARHATFLLQDMNIKDGAFTQCSIYLSHNNKNVVAPIILFMQPTYKDIGNLSPNTQYSVKVVCNSYDNKRIESTVRYFQTPESKPTAKPKNLILKSGNSSLIAFWEPVKNGLNGNFTGYNVCIIAGQNSRHDLKNCFMTNESRYTSFQVKPSSTYSVAVSVCTKVGCGPSTFEVTTTDNWIISSTPSVYLPSTTVGATSAAHVPVVLGYFNFVYVGIAVLAIVIVIVVVVAIVCKKRAKQPKNGANPVVVYAPQNGEGQYEVPLLQPVWSDAPNAYADIPPLQTPTLSKETSIKLDDVKFNCKQVSLSSLIGKGEFGRVYKGQFTPSLRSDDSIEVAVKTMIMQEYEQSEYEEFVKEGLRMKSMDHPNVMKLIGICLPAETNTNFSNSRSDLRMSGLEAISPLVIVPYMPNGDLKHYLYNARVKKQTHEIGLSQLIQFAYDIACGMEYLAAKHIVHRDLACRNCMLDANMSVVVSDFGLSRQIYSSSYYIQKRAAKMPVKWMAIESLMDRVYTSMTDVWAFGVTAWEIFTYCQNPFPGVENHEMLELLKAGTRLKRPSTCPNDVWNDAIYPCWDPRSEERPTFTELAEMFAGFKKLHHHETAVESSENCFYVNMESADEGYERLVSKSRGNTVSSENNEIPMPYETAVVRLPSGKVIPKRGRGSSRNPLIKHNSEHSDGSEEVVDL